MIIKEECSVQIIQYEESDIVCVDSSIEKKKASVKESKSRIERFKELVNQSTSKHLSSVSSIDAIRILNEHDDSIYIFDSSDFNVIEEKLLKAFNIKHNKVEINNTLNYIKEELRIEKNQTSCLLQPKLRVAENFGIRPAVYDFVYFMDHVQEPKLERFNKEFRLN